MGVRLEARKPRNTTRLVETSDRLWNADRAAGLVLDHAQGWWWADRAAALIIAAAAATGAWHTMPRRTGAADGGM